MGAPSPAASNVTTGAPGDIGAMMREPAPAKPARGYWRFELPESVKDSMYWTGTDADLVFGLWEPTAAEIRTMVKAEAEYSQETKNFIAMIGDRPVVDNTTEVIPWWERLSPRAQTLVVTEFVALIMPTEAEGKSVRDSKKWVR